MATPRVFIDIIKRIVNKQHAHYSDFTSTIKVNHEKWIENLLWISKFAFDHGGRKMCWFAPFGKRKCME